jgi:HlyD family secretion protein
MGKSRTTILPDSNNRKCNFGMIKGVKMNRMFIFVVLIIIWSGCGNNNDDLITGSGTIEATEVVVSAAGTGEVIHLETDEGRSVTAGDTLAVIDHEKLSIQLEANDAALRELAISYQMAQKDKEKAQLQFENQEKKYRRMKALLAKESATQQQYDDSYTAYEIAQTQLQASSNQLDLIQAKREQLLAANRLLETQIDDAYILAPLTGFILKKYHERGEFVVPGTALFRIADLSEVWLKTYISEMQLGYVKLNQTANILVDAFPDKPFAGRVAWISPKAEFTPKNVQTQEARLNLVYAVKIEVDNIEQQLKIGMPVDVEIEIK